MRVTIGSHISVKTRLLVWRVFFSPDEYCLQVGSSYINGMDNCFGKIFMNHSDDFLGMNFKMFESKRLNFAEYLLHQIVISAIVLINWGKYQGLSDKRSGFAK